MNVVERARDGYSQTAVHMKTPRDTEYEVIARISHRLRSAAQNRNSDFPAYVSALHDNNKLWTTLAVNVAQPDNTLPKELRARLFWLAEFTSQETRKLLRNDGDVGALIEINAAVLQGLRNQEQNL
ncbi:MAG: flagellar biosynthesis regulator FlaF [Paracoccaceae bacterium]|nr:flagellar biosynthesis regulator FlaF [Paracoccaceae bacterium]